MPNNYGERIKAARKKAGLTQKELGEKIGNLSAAAVGQWENNLRTPTICSLTRMSKAIGCDVQDLLPDEMKYKKTEVAKNNPYWERISRLAEKQRTKGMSKYGVGLENNTANAIERVRHIQEELIDALMYLTWLEESLKEGEADDQ